MYIHSVKQKNQKNQKYRSFLHDFLRLKMTKILLR